MKIKIASPFVLRKFGSLPFLAWYHKTTMCSCVLLSTHESSQQPSYSKKKFISRYYIWKFSCVNENVTVKSPGSRDEDYQFPRANSHVWRCMHGRARMHLVFRFLYQWTLNGREKKLAINKRLDADWQACGCVRHATVHAPLQFFFLHLISC